VPRELAQLDGTECNKIGVSYYAFNLAQSNACNANVGSCLLNQIKNLRESDIAALKSNTLPKYILPAWGLQWTNNLRQLKLPVLQMQNTMLRLEVDAELIRFVKNVAKGTINSVVSSASSPTKTVISAEVSNTDRISGQFTLEVT
jgi:hypothetical protein